nr:zinc finger, CCHC-type [Tanacetum cinerariifolium]
YYGESPISWSTQKQATVALSSCESEFFAATAAATQALWLKRLLSRLTHSDEEKITILVDNKSAIALMKNPVFHGRSKHIDTKYHFIRECVKRDDIQTLVYLIFALSEFTIQHKMPGYFTQNVPLLQIQTIDSSSLPSMHKSHGCIDDSNRFYEIRKKLLSNCSTNQRYDTLARSRKYNRCSSWKSKFTIKYPTAYIRIEYFMLFSMMNSFFERCCPVGKSRGLRYDDAVTKVRAAMEAADNEFTRWEVQEREVDENALCIPYVYSEQLMKTKRKSVRALLWALFDCTVFVPIALCVDCFIEAFAWRVVNSLSAASMAALTSVTALHLKGKSKVQTQRLIFCL